MPTERSGELFNNAFWINLKKNKLHFILMTIRKILVTFVGHVDHGKTTLLDTIRHTTVAAAEKGGITQAVGVTIVPLETIKRICGKLLDVLKQKSMVPGLLCIDTPGHAAFTSLRKRGGSLADIAILVVDINEGFKPQTIESIEILKANKVPFVIAANKIDIISGWSYDPQKFLLDNINQLDYNLQGLFEKKMYELVAQVNEHTFSAERFDRVSDYTKQIAIVPLSAKTGQGIPELLMVIIGLAQKFLEQKLLLEEKGPAKGTILEVKEEKGLGMTVDTIIYNGQLKVNDTIILGGVDAPIITKVRALLEPAESSTGVKKLQNVKEVTAATGVKIVAPGMEKAIAGMPLRSCSGKPEEIERLKKEVQEEIKSILFELEQCLGVIIKADTIGGLEALQNILKEKNIPISSASLGDITKRDLSRLESLQEQDEFKAVLLGFNVSIPLELEESAKNRNLKIITNNVIYRI